MGMISRRGLPLGPLLHAYRAAGVPSIAELHRLPGLGGRFAAILGASARFLYADFLDRATPEAFGDALARFYEAAVTPALHAETLRRRAGFLRHALCHLVHGRDPAPRRLAACLAAGGVYRVPGLGPSFWSALLQGLSPARHPGWTPTVRAGLDRAVGRAGHDSPGPAELYAELIDLHGRVRSARPDLTSLHIDHFLAQLAHMPGRDLAAGAAGLTECPVGAVLRRLRNRRPLRERLKERGAAIALGQEKLEWALARGDGAALADALALGDPPGAARANLAGLRADGFEFETAARLWRSEEPLEELERLWAGPRAGVGLWLGPAVLHLRDPQRFGPFSDLHRAGHQRLDEGVDAGDPAGERYRLYNAAGSWLRERHGAHPLEVPELFVALSGRDDAGESSGRVVHRGGRPGREARFTGFCADTFAFLAELERDNRRDWMHGQRDRYVFAVRGPLAELCADLTRRWVEPVLAGVHGWAFDTRRRTGHALTSVCRNVFGRSSPYTSTLWITFCPEGVARASAQLFVRLSPAGLRWGLRLGRAAREHRRRLADNVKAHGEAVWRLLQDSGAGEECLFGQADAPDSLRRLEGVEGLIAWAGQRTAEVSVGRPAGDALLRDEQLAGSIILTLDRLLPLFACAVEADPRAALARIGGPGWSPGGADARADARAGARADFGRHTYLPEEWLRQALDLLALKKQLILQGVPGTGKTHVARCLARLLARGVEDAVRLVQFHPAFSYEEFVEGVRVRSVAVEGRHDVTYPVEDGLLCSFARRAAEHPSQPHVLIIDEINRGNLPRIFGELLYLLEYRGQAVELPCSRRAFRLPDNLYLVATMNAGDRSIALIDQALRRRFSFLPMEPDAGVLTAWLAAHPPRGGAALAARVVGLFDRLNARLRGELGPQAQLGHSYFMVPGLDEARLRMVWKHHVRPLLDELYAGQPGRAAALDSLLDGEPARPRPGRVGAGAGARPPS